MNPLPTYEPPQTQRACVAAAVAPLLVLLGFTLIVTKVIEVDTGFALFTACTIWVIHEMSSYQRALNFYNAKYAGRHLAWRSDDALESLVQQPGTAEATRVFVLRYLCQPRIEDGLRA